MGRFFREDSRRSVGGRRRVRRAEGVVAGQQRGLALGDDGDGAGLGERLLELAAIGETSQIVLAGQTEEVILAGHALQVGLPREPAERDGLLDPLVLAGLGRPGEGADHDPLGVEHAGPHLLEGGFLCETGQVSRLGGHAVVVGEGLEDRGAAGRVDDGGLHLGQVALAVVAEGRDGGQERGDERGDQRADDEAGVAAGRGGGRLGGGVAALTVALVVGRDRVVGPAGGDDGLVERGSVRVGVHGAQANLVLEEILDHRLFIDVGPGGRQRRDEPVETGGVTLAIRCHAEVVVVEIEGDGGDDRVHLTLRPSGDLLPFRGARSVCCSPVRRE